MVSSNFDDCTTGRSDGEHLENPVRHSTAGPAICIYGVVAIAHQPAIRGEFAVDVHSRDGVTRCQRDNLLAPAGKERIGTDEERARRAAAAAVAKVVSISLGVRALRTSSCRPERPNAASCALARRVLGFGIFRVHHQGEDSGVGHEFVQQPQSPCRRAWRRTS